MPYTKLIRQAAEHAIKYGEIMPPPDPIPSEMLHQQACYITILENPGKRYRNMYGSVLPRQRNLALEMIFNTTTAIFQAPGSQIRKADISRLTYSIMLIGALQRVSDKIHLDPQNYGLYLTSDQGKAALILPGRVGIETPDDQIATALREAGIRPRDEATTMYRFLVEFYSA